MQRRAVWLLCALTLSVVGAGTAGGSEPSRGTVGPVDQGAQSSITWKGPPPPGGISGPVVLGCPEDPTVYCDTFDLEVAVPPEYWTGKAGGVEIEISWPDPADQYKVCTSDNVCESSSDVRSTDHRFGSIRIFVDRPSGPLRIRVQYEQVADNRDGYTGVARFVSSSAATPAVFDEQTGMDFGPATIVSAHFLGPEPQVTVERPSPSQVGGPLLADRMFVDWPMGLASTSSQLHRSEDGGDSFRLLFDMGCPQRNRPGCATAGGADSDAAVNPVNGNLYFADLETGNVAFATSETHGDDFPPDQQKAISNPAIPPADRQWVAGADPTRFRISEPGKDRPTRLQAFLAYDEGLITKVIQGIDLAGNPVPQPDPQIPAFSGEKGPLLADNTQGPGAGWLYLGGGDVVATVHSSNYQKPEGTEGGWRVNRVMPVPHNGVELFQWLALDEAGNAYATWVPTQPEDSGKPAVVMFAASPIDDPRNDPRDGGWPGAHWTEPIQVSLPRLGSAIFASVTAGAEGRVGLAYMATDDHVGPAGTAPGGAEWKTYGAVMTNALDQEGPLIVRTTEVSERIAHLGPICTGGLIGCDVQTGDRSLLDLIDISFDIDGRLTVVSMDNHSSFAEKSGGIPIAGEKKRPFAHVSKQIAGPSLFPGEDLSIPLPTSPVSDPAADANWPNAATGTNLQAFDLREASLQLEGSDLVARITLADASSAAMTRDLGTYAASYPLTAPPAERLQYILRFSTEQDIYHLSFEHQMGGARRGFGGRLDDNDRLLTNSRPGASTNGVGYHTDGVKVDARIEDNTLVLTVPAGAFGLAEGARLFSVTAFATAGPLEENEQTTENIMRTVDASPPFDVTLTRTVSPTPTPTVSPTPAPAPVPSTSPSPQPTGHCDIIGTPEDDYLPGTEAGETICGRGGDDVLIGGGGDDTLLGGVGDDRLLGQAGQDVLNGRRGSDELRGGTDRDILLGRPGADMLFGGSDDDFLRGGRGRDRCRGGSGRNQRRSCEHF